MWDKLVKIGIISILVITMAIMGVAIFDSNNKGEANMGSFEAEDFNDSWILHANGQEEEVTLPASADVGKGGEIVLTKTLPDDLTDGMSLLARSRLSDILIYVDGELREEYSSDSIGGMSYYLPSSYVVCALNEEDSSKEIRLVYHIKTQGVTGAVYISHGNNVWFDILKNGLPVNLIALGVFVMGIILLFISFFLERALGAGTTRSLSFLMMDIGMWVLSESTLRQFLFQRPSLSRFFAYLTVESIGAFACMYFDEVQHRKYHKAYLVMESLVLLQLIANVILAVSGVAELYQTIIFSHIWQGLSVPVVVVTIVSDVRKKRVKEYFITLIGMLCFTVLALCELLNFYINRMGGLGTFLCLAMLALMTATILQAVYDVAQYQKDREKKQTEMAVNTIEIIASAIDARDEYTGGHSERVGIYACRLAREVAAEYSLTDEDILRIQYIALVHDIGKIGVADDVLNKSGKLNDEEFSLMKKHSEIGYEIMSSLGEGITGLLDGIRHHHERFDGTGYPDGLSGTDIPLIARILAIADSYDAMTSNRVYRKRMTDEEVRSELVMCKGTQFDPALTEVFLELLDSGEISANTVNGAAADENGQVRNSALLESKLQKDLLRKKNILNPAHVRMLCYVIKLMEKKGRDFAVLFVGFDAGENEDVITEWEHLNETFRQYMNPYDMNIQYTPGRKILALYDRSGEELREFTEACREACPGVVMDEMN